MSQEARNTMSKIDEGVKIIYNVLLMAILAILSWSVVETNNTTKTVIELQGKVDLTNAHLEYLRADLAALPKREEVDSIKTTVKSIEGRVTKLETWVSDEGKDPNRYRR